MALFLCLHSFQSYKSRARLWVLSELNIVKFGESGWSPFTMNGNTHLTQQWTVILLGHQAFPTLFSVVIKVVIPVFELTIKMNEFVCMSRRIDMVKLLLQAVVVPD